MPKQKRKNKPDKKKSSETVYAFIDSQNLNPSIKNDIYRNKKLLYKGWYLDFKKTRIFLRDKYSVNKAFLFIGYLETNTHLYANLRKFGYRIIFKPTIKDHRGKPKGNVDAELVLHTMIQWGNFDKAIIISGDGDFYCLVDYLSKKDKLNKLLIPNQYSYSKLLLKFKGNMSYLNQARSKLEYKKWQ